MRSLRRDVFKFLKDNPKANIYDLYFEFKHANHHTLKKYKSEYKKIYGMYYSKMQDVYRILSHVLYVQARKVQLIGNLSGDERVAIDDGKQLVQ